MEEVGPRRRPGRVQARREVRRRLLVGPAREARSGSSTPTTDTLEYVPPWLGQRMQWLSDERAARVSLTWRQLVGLRRGSTRPGWAATCSRTSPRCRGSSTSGRRTGPPAPSPNLGWAQSRLSRPGAGGGAGQALGSRSSTSSGWTRTTPCERGTSGWRRSSQARTALTERRFDAIHLQGPGTDLTIGLLPSSKWLGADFETVGRHHALPEPARPRRSSRRRIPSGSTATSRRRCRSRCTARYIDGIRIEFEGGRAVRADADVGADALPPGDREGRRRVAARRARARRSRGPDRPARDGLLRHVARRERGQPSRARQRATRSRSRTRPSARA